MERQQQELALGIMYCAECSSHSLCDKHKMQRQGQELVLARQWSRDHANAESRRARQEIYAALFACPTSPETISALENIHRILGRPLTKPESIRASHAAP